MENFNITDKSSFLKLSITEVLRTVPDPELNINIIDLGLVYGIDLADGKRIIVTMTLSSRHCPMGEAILDSVRNSLSHNFPEYEIEVLLVWEPVWNYDKISEEGLRQLKG